MKKFVILLLAACLLLGCGVGYYSAKQAAKGEGEPVALTDPENLAPEVAEPSAAPVESTESAENALGEIRSLDYEALAALHPMDEIVGDVSGREVRWGDYYYWLGYVGEQAETYIATMAMYGQSIDWDDKLSADSEQTFAEYMVEMAQSNLRQLCTIESFAEENGVVLTAEDEAALAAQLQTDIADACGEGAPEEDFNAYLAENRISREMYDRLGRLGYLFQNGFNALYGENGEKVAESEAIAYLEDNAYLCATHILFMTLDPATYETLDDEAAAEKLARAEAVSAELRGIEDVEERIARFAALKEEYCEDSGKTAYPEGYLFTPGTMVEEFESEVKALEDYEVSEPVKSAYGYHVIMRLPLSAEMTVDYADADTPRNARSLYANAQYSSLMDARFEQSVLTLIDDVAALDLRDYLK